MSSMSTPENAGSNQSTRRRPPGYLPHPGAPKKVKFGRSCAGGYAVAVTPGHKLSLRRRAQLLKYGPDNQEGVPQALGYDGGMIQMLHAEHRGLKRRYNRDVKKALKAGKDITKLTKVKPLSFGDCFAPSCSQCHVSDSSSGEESDSEISVAGPSGLQSVEPDYHEMVSFSRGGNAIGPFSNNVVESPVDLSLSGFDDSYFEGGAPESFQETWQNTPELLSMGSYLVQTDAITPPNSPTLHLEESQILPTAVDLNRAVGSVGLPQEVQECLEKTLQELKTRHALDLARMGGLEKQNAALKEALELSKAFECNPDTMLQVDLSELEGLNHQTHFSSESGRFKLERALGSIATTGVLGPTIALVNSSEEKSGKYITARMPMISNGDLEDLKGGRQFFLHYASDPCKLGDSFECCIPISISGLKRLLREYGAIILFLIGVHDSFSASADGFSLQGANGVILEDNIKSPSGNSGAVTLTCNPVGAGGVRTVTFRFEYTRAFKQYAKVQNKHLYSVMTFTASTLTFLVRDVLPLFRCMDEFHATGMRMLLNKFNVDLPKNFTGPHKVVCGKHRIPHISLERGVCVPEPDEIPE
jgi:hypothetical protein